MGENEKFISITNGTFKWDDDTSSTIVLIENESTPLLNRSLDQSGQNNSFLLSDINIQFPLGKLSLIVR